MRLHLYIFILLFILLACSRTPIEPEIGDGPRDSENSKPVIQSILLSMNQVSPGDSLYVKASATDSDGDSLFYMWSAESGNLESPTDSTSLWILSSSIAIGSQPRLTLTVTDGIDSVSAFKTIDIIARDNTPPMIDSLNVSSSEVFAGESVRINVSATDADGDLLSYQWTTGSGIISNPDQANTNWTLPLSAEQGSNHKAIVTVSDGKISVSDSVTVVIARAANDPPVIESISFSSIQVFSGDTILVTAQVSDPNSDSLLIKWSTEQGIILSPNLIKTSWIIPEDALVGSKPGITLLVSDGLDSVSVSRSVEIIEIINNIPVITSFNISAREVTPGGFVQLSATASDDDGDNLLFKWSSDAGELVSADSSATLWQFPLTAQVGQMPEVSLTVSDGNDSVSTSGTITIIAGISISGHVYYRDTKIPIPDVKVSVNNLSASTDENGFYQIDYIPAEGNYELQAFKEGFDEYNKKVTISEMNTIFNIELNSEELTGVLSGTIHTIDEIKLSGMKIWLLNPDRSLSLISAVSARDGSYLLSHIPPGSREFYVANESSIYESLPDSFQLEIKDTGQEHSSRIKIRREAYKEVGTENYLDWQRVDAEVISDAYSLSGAGGFLKMLKLIDIPVDAEKLVYTFYKIIHIEGFQDCHYGLFNEKGEGQPFSYELGNRTKNWTTVSYEYDERYMGHGVYLQFWTTGESSRFLIFETEISYFW